MIKLTILLSMICCTSMAQDITYQHEGVYVSVPNTDYISKLRLYEDEMAWRKYRLKSECLTRVKVAEVRFAKEKM